jgi:uncharacterized protein YgiM (DUF1202 family)
MRRNQNTFILLFIFFIAIAVGSLFALDGKNSVFDRGINTLGVKNALLNELVVGTQPQDMEESFETSDPEPDEETKIQQEQVSVPSDVKEPSDDGVRFFILTVNTKNTILRLREEPSTKSAVIDKLEKGSSGYVLQPGNIWCKVSVPSGMTGNVATKNIKVTEVLREEFPEDLRECVTAPTEILSEAFEETDDN